MTTTEKPLNIIYLFDDVDFEDSSEENIKRIKTILINNYNNYNYHYNNYNYYNNYYYNNYYYNYTIEELLFLICSISYFQYELDAIIAAEQKKAAND